MATINYAARNQTDDSMRRHQNATDISSVVVDNPHLIVVNKPSADGKKLRRMMVHDHDNARCFIMDWLLNSSLEGANREQLIATTRKKFGLFRYEVYHILNSLEDVIDVLEEDGTRTLLLTSELFSEDTERTVGGDV